MFIALGVMAGAPKDKVTVVDRPPASGKSQLYVANREPLLPNPLIKLPIGAIRPEGWLREQLRLMADGFPGRLAEISPWCKPEDNAWLSPKGEGKNGWEELPYWLKGFGDLGYVLGDERIIAEAKRWIEGALGSRRPGGWFGPVQNRAEPDLWPNMPMLNALQSYYEFSGDKRVLELMTGYFRYELDHPKKDILPAFWAKMRGGDNLESVFWLYNRTGEKWLLDLAKRLHECTADWTAGLPMWHGVNLAQGFREPAEYYVLSRDPKHLNATERDYQTFMGLYGQVPGGGFGADENCREGFDDPRQGTESCTFVELMHSFQMLFAFGGDPKLADRCEEVAFNDIPAAFMADWKGLHYLTAPNQPQLDKENHSPGIQNTGCMFAFNAADYRCCQHNVAMGWPYYAEHLWMATRDGGLAALLYAASSVKAKVGTGETVTITEATDYPFREKVQLQVSAEKPIRFPLYLRIPGWCEGAKVTVNGRALAVKPKPLSYVAINRTWKDGDKVALTMPMAVEIKVWKKNRSSISVRRGPLWFSLKIGEKWQRFGGTDKWPAFEVFPTTPWNYGILIDGFPTVSLKPGSLAPQPFMPETAPVTIKLHGKRIPGWQMVGGLVEPLQLSPVRSGERVETLTLIPMGCARLRISSFPVIGDGPDAHEWKAPPAARHTASHLCPWDDLEALSDGILPKASNDLTIKRFSWWDHKGTEEWVTFSFDKLRRVSRCEVYWFDDTGTGECRVPVSWEVLWRDGDVWRPVTGASEYGVERDKFNAVKFNPVTTTVLKLVVKLRPGFSSGILEWTVGP